MKVQDNSRGFSHRSAGYKPRSASVTPVAVIGWHPVEHRWRRAARRVRAGRPSVARLIASLGACTGTMCIGDRVRVLLFVEAGFVVASLLSVLCATNAWSEMTALG